MVCKLAQDKYLCLQSILQHGKLQLNHEVKEPLGIILLPLFSRRETQMI